ncbi:15092_t:CDS:2 [Racocetra fulgida]|uniref:15092_t:CDS:1 n=1 Tax=Racocetra fulgida TaxID=60492 RepID=A0A9N8WDA8_9GLOM|nr:15092_t:CDS:2 [Racocetra fulgida]
MGKLNQYIAEVDEADAKESEPMLEILENFKKIITEKSFDLPQSKMTNFKKY